MSRFLANLLALVAVHSNSHVCNSKEFAEFSPSMPWEKMRWWYFSIVCSSCVLQLTLQSSRLENAPTFSERAELLVDDIVSLPTLRLNATYLEFRGKMYQQVHETTMGSPVSVLIANLVMEDVEQRAFGYPSFLSLLLEMLCGWHFHSPTQQPGAGFLSHLNSIKPCIQSTYQKETEDGKLPFLDVCMCSESDGLITTSVYWKGMHTNQYLAMIHTILWHTKPHWWRFWGTEPVHYHLMVWSMW